MTRMQLREFYTPEERARIYNHTYDHTKWGDHIERIERTVTLVDELAARTHARTIADLSCGDGAVLEKSRHDWDRYTYGDLTTTGPIEETLPKLEHVDLYVCTETLEHVEDPDWLLTEIRAQADALVLSTPESAWQDGNPEHYWAWSSDDVDVMLWNAGWEHRQVELFTPSYPYYVFQMWMCRA